MPRPMRPLDPSRGPAQAFAADLRGLWERAGRPTFLAMSRSTGRSKTALSEATGGDHLPTWETVEAFVRACGEDPRRWQARYDHAAAQLRPPAQSAPTVAPPTAVPAAPTLAVPAGSAAAPAPDPAVTAFAPDTAPSATGWFRRPSQRQWFALVMVAAVSSAGVVLGLVLRDAPGAAAEGNVARVGSGSTIVRVQNKVAVGADALLEDSTSAFLSSRPVARCRSRGCELPGTEMWSGAPLAVTCQTRGETFTNANLDSPGIEQNPDAATSVRWYGASVTGSSTLGYLPEVFVAPEHRGGLGLPACPPA